MSITPQGGWEAAPQKDHTRYASRSSYLACKICDSGTLSPKSAFRMSGPVVAIGFILLIPSVIGMIFSALMFFGVIAVGGDGSSTVASEPSRPFQSAFDASFRQSCADNFRQNFYQKAGVSASPSLTEGYCECALSTFKGTGSETTAGQVCNERALEGTLAQPNQNVDAFYSGDAPHETRDTVGSNRIGTLLGSAFFVGLGIASFVGGLLGWLLVMRKRVLQCDTCGAVVNAS